MALSIHVGAHKTASTHLQQTLRTLIGPMLQAGIHYQDISHLRRGWARLDASVSDGSGAARKRLVWRQRVAQLSEVWPDLILSEENLLGSIRRASILGDAGVYPEAASRMKRLSGVLNDQPTTVFLSIRNPLSFLRSAFAMQVEGGFELEFADYLDGRDPTQVSWSDLGARLLNVPGVTRLIVWRYESYDAVRPELLRALVPDRVAARAPRLPHAVVGMSHAAYDEIRRQMAADATADQFVVARAAKTQFPRGPGQGPLSLSDAATEARVAAAYAEDVERLSRMPGVRLIG